MKIGVRLHLNTWIALAALLLMAVSLFFTFRQIGQADRNEALVNEMRQVAFERLILRGESFLVRSPRAAVQWRNKTESLRGLLAEAAERFPAGEERLLLQEAQRQFDETTALSALLMGTPPAKRAGASRAGAGERETRLISQLLLRAYKLNGSLDKLYEAAEKSSRQTRNRAFLLNFILVLGGGLAIIANSLFVRRVIARRLRVLHAGVARIGGGDLDHRIEATGDDELADLAAASNRMAAGLKESYTAIENLHREIAARREAEEKLSSLFENAAEGIYQSTPDGRLLAANPAFARILGYDTPGELLAAVHDVSAQLYVDPGQRQELLRRLAGEDIVKDDGIRLYRRDGAVVYLSVSARAVRDDAGTLVRLEGMVEDITERRRAEAALRASEENFHRSLDESPLGVRIVSEEGETIYANRAILDIYGYATVGELQASSAQDRYTPAGYAAFRERREKRRRGEETPPEYEIEIVRKDGEVRHLQVFRKEILWDGVPRYQVLYNDITERKRAEAALRLSEERYRAFVKQSSEAICLFEIAHAPIAITLPPDEQIDLLYAQAVIGECNQKFADSHGYGAPEEMLGFRIGQIFPRLAQENVAYLRHFIESGHQLANVETKELSRDGTVKHFLNSLIGHVEEGRLLRVWGAKQDITRIKQAEEEIRLLNEELEQRVRERTAELEAANRELEAFSYSVSHDLRAPLRAIDGYTRMLTEDYGGRLDDEGRRICGVIRDSTRDMGRLIDDLLSFSRVGRAELRRREVDMTALAQAAFFELTAPAERVRIDFRVAPLPPAQGDPTLLRRVWVNLIGNAVKFSGRRERALIEVGVAPDATGRERRGGRPDEAAGGEPDGKMPAADRQGPVYFVRDNGAGFDMAYGGKLFGVFQRLHGAREFEGTGVGLAIAQRIIHRHGGRIWAEGEVGRGATFYFTLPA